MIDLHTLNNIEAGVSPTEVKEFQQQFELTAGQMAFLMNISRKGYYNMLTAEKLSRQQSERFLTIRQVYQQALDTLETVENIHKWMNAYHGYLERVPFEILDTYAGCYAVGAELLRFEHGIVP